MRYLLVLMLLFSACGEYVDIDTIPRTPINEKIYRILFNKTEMTDTEFKDYVMDWVKDIEYQNIRYIKGNNMLQKEYTVFAVIYLKEAK